MIIPQGRNAAAVSYSVMENGLQNSNTLILFQADAAREIVS